MFNHYTKGRNSWDGLQKIRPELELFIARLSIQPMDMDTVTAVKNGKK